MKDLKHEEAYNDFLNALMNSGRLNDLLGSFEQYYQENSDEE